MIKILAAALVLAFGTRATASGTLAERILMNQHDATIAQLRDKGLDWKVGDENDYGVDLGFIKGSMITKVVSIGADGLWMSQDLDLGFAGRQKVETLLDLNTGEIKKMIVNGKEEALPKNDFEVIEMNEDNITVPAGQFDCIHARFKDRADNQESNIWINPQLIPLSGMLKSVQPTNLGTATIQLVKFRKN